MKTKTILALPSLGILFFIALYIYAASLYPGGSQADQNSVGFSWVHNYWCNLLSKQSINGQVNLAQPIAKTAMAVLCFSLMLFFIQFAQYFTKSILWKRLISINGILSMFCAFFITLDNMHDLMTTFSSLFGVIVVIGIIKDVYKYALPSYKIGGLLCIALLALNNIIYYSSFGLEYLPAIQKITFALVLFWIVHLNLYLINRSKSSFI